MNVRHCVAGYWLTVTEHPYKFGRLLAVITNDDPENVSKAQVLDVRDFPNDGAALEWFRERVEVKPWASS